MHFILVPVLYDELKKFKRFSCKEALNLIFFYDSPHIDIRYIFERKNIFENKVKKRTTDSIRIFKTSVELYNGRLLQHA